MTSRCVLCDAPLYTQRLLCIACETRRKQRGWDYRTDHRIDIDAPHPRDLHTLTHNPFAALKGKKP